MNIYYLGFIPVITILICGFQFWKANGERNLGFTILWFILLLYFSYSFSGLMGGAR